MRKPRKRQIKRAFHKWRLKWLSRQREVDISDCRNCDKWKTCENGEKGHANGTSIGYSVGECKEYKHIKENKQGVLEQIAEEQKTLSDTTKAWSDYIEKHGDIY